jgi:hypothetical protein
MKTIDIALKDMLRSFRSLFAVGMMVAAPLLLTGLISFAFSGLASGESTAQLPNIRVAVVNLDEKQSDLPYLGEMVLAFLQDERMPAWLVVSELTSETSARAAVERQEIGVAVIIPAEFTSVLLQEGEKSTIQVLHDPTLTVGPGIVKSLLQQFVDGVSSASIALEVIDNQTQLAQQDQAAVAQEYMTWFTTAPAGTQPRQPAGVGGAGPDRDRSGRRCDRQPYAECNRIDHGRANDLLRLLHRRIYHHFAAARE